MPRVRVSLSILLVALATFFPLTESVAANGVLALWPASMTHWKGSASGNLSALKMRDQNSDDDNPARYVSFQPGVGKYDGYREYRMPATVAPAAVRAMRVEVNFNGPPPSEQAWSWSLYNWSTSLWVGIGGNTRSTEWEWDTLVFTISNPQRFISSAGKIRLRLTSSNARYEGRVDYEAVHLLYTPATPPAPASAAIPLPPTGQLYHGVYPGGRTGEEDDLRLSDLTAYDAAAGKTAAWVYFSDNWYHGRSFPTSTAAWIRRAGRVPYIRLMLRSDPNGGRADPLFSLARILSGAFDNDLHGWCAGARNFRTRLIAEYGTEVNGEWFPWNGKWNGGGVKTGYGDPTQPDGPERFRDAYRHIIQICREEGANNITWVFHVNDGDFPETSWNQFENYYPGDGYIDWLAVSSYGAQTPLDDYWPIFRESMDAAYPRLAALSSTRPIIVAEFGVTTRNPLGSQSQWAQAALTDLVNFRWPRIIGFSWWNEWWQNDNNPAHDTDMRLQTNSALAHVFQLLVGNNANVLGSIP